MKSDIYISFVAPCREMLKQVEHDGDPMHFHIENSDTSQTQTCVIPMHIGISGQGNNQKNFEEISHPLLNPSFREYQRTEFRFIRVPLLTQ